MDIVSMLVPLVTGAVGGNIGGAILKNQSLGPVGNSIAGILGGGLGSQILGSVLGSGAADGGMLSQLAGGGVGGIVVMVVVGFIKNMMSKN